MADLHVRNLPETLFARLVRYAQRRRWTVSDVAVRALEREMDRCEWFERLAQRPQTDLGVSASSLLEEERRCSR